VSDKSIPPPGETDLVSARVEQLYAAHREQLMLFLLGMLRDRSAAEDVLQQTFSKLHGQLKQQQRPAVPPCSAEETEGNPVSENTLPELTAGWLFRVARNEAVQLKRDQLRAARHQQGLSWFWEHTRSEQRDELVDLEQREKIWQVVDELPAEMRQVIHLRIVDDLKFREIADKLGIPLGTVLTRMTRAVKLLRQRIEE